MDLSELERLENPAKVLKLSEAIRIGARKHPQLIGVSQWMHNGRTCLFGAAAIGRGWDGKHFIEDFVSAEERWRVTKAYIGRYLQAPQTASKNGTLTRELFADRLEAMGL